MKRESEGPGQTERRQLARLALGRPAHIRGTSEHFGWVLNVTSHGVLVEIPSPKGTYACGEELTLDISLEAEHLAEVLWITGRGRIVRAECTSSAWRYAIHLDRWERMPTPAIKANSRAAFRN